MDQCTRQDHFFQEQKTSFLKKFFLICFIHGCRNESWLMYFLFVKSFNTQEIKDSAEILIAAWTGICTGSGKEHEVKMITVFHFISTFNVSFISRGNAVLEVTDLFDELRE